MAAKDGSTSFNFTGTYTVVQIHGCLEYDMDGDDKRHVRILFSQVPEGTKITETFDMEDINPEEMQRGGWQSILNTFKDHVEAQA